MNTITHNISRQSQIEHWEDLLPSPTKLKSDFVDPFDELTPGQLEDLAILSRIRWLISSNKADPNGASAQEAKQIEKAFVKQGIDVEWLLSKRQMVRQQRIEQTTNNKIEAKDIKLSGVILPLYWNNERLLTHFLLMPYLGQCSHFPPPPPNQVIFVESTEPIAIQKLTANLQKSQYSLVWVSIEGTINLAATSHQVFRVDGMSWLESSYGAICHNISLCSPKEIAQVLAWQTREERKSLYPKLTELILVDIDSN
ncbi:Protein of unknown function (DUF3299) [Xenococcus sp. PCC 7305]|uniref:DUF3299 domain-containing protein n=1 Tax=Xenococcus sp. PCC 7305 TaxID=102125 RepID=UPI0002AD0693|nr:DUF3299 domain-containing protein [Xenococcus sp. PCC 7305]ELS00695.1 Protein of unknown function (DUF3299) [Xenococcus sp. PCC 7305]